MASPPSSSSSPFVQAATTLVRRMPTVAPTFVVVAMVVCVLVPLPTPLVDLLLSVSLAGSVLLLVGSLTTGRSSEFSSFPSLLLLATLYRLALNVSTTRLILSQADAGRVVDAFASIVVRGDLIVGGVMFAIITIVQFGVIARGAERVAEVAARFALDGLPGHQAAIDADLRAGVISAREASRRRAALGERSSFYGAMDGAIRFVKGDAVAGLAITAVNLIGGLAIGMGRDGLTWSDSLLRYGQLTVGDGLLAQIPALLVSLAAGVLVARVDRRDEPGEARGVLSWLQPAMLVVPAGLLAGLAVVPGMPKLAFFATSAVLLAVAMGLTLRALATSGPATDVEAAAHVLVHIHPSAVADHGDLERALAGVRAKCQATLSIPVPRVQLRPSHAVPEGALDVLLCGRPLPRRTLPAEPETTPGGARPEVGSIVLETFRAVMDAAPELIDLQQLDQMLEVTRRTHPVVVARALERVELVDVLGIVRGFLRERVRVPSLVALLGVVAEDRRFHEASERHRFAELARIRLRDHWLFAEMDGLRKLGLPRVVRLTPDAEELLTQRTITSTGSVDTPHKLTLVATERARWVQAVRDMAPSGSGAVVLVTRGRARSEAAALMRGESPRVVVLSAEEMEHVGEALSDRWVDVDDVEPEPRA